MRIAGLLVALILLAVGVLPAHAAANTVSVDNTWVINFTQTVAGFTPEQRATEADKRIQEVLSRFRAGDQITVEPAIIGQTARITVNGLLVFTLVTSDVPTTGVPLAEYARQVAKRLEKGILASLIIKDSRGL